MSADAFPTRAYRDHLDRLAAMNDDERMSFVIAKGRELDPDDAAKIMRDGEEMSGCQARVWIAASRAPDGRVTFEGASEAAIVQGLARIMSESFSGLTAVDLASVRMDAIRAFPLGAMTTHRQVGMMAMLKHMQRMDLA